MVSELPMDIISQILILLPAKPLSRFKCVSKHWNSHITNPKFITRHLSLALSSPVKNRVLVVSRGSHLEVSSTGFDPNSINFTANSSKFELPSELHGLNAVICGSVNGLLLLRCGSVKRYKLLLWNPCTNAYYLLPRDPSCPINSLNVSFGFGYDGDDDDYKIVRITDFLKTDNDDEDVWGDNDDNNDGGVGGGRQCVSGVMLREVCVYSLKEDQWRVLYIAFTGDMMTYHDHGAVVNNIAHWVFGKIIAGGNLYIRGFHLGSYEWTKLLSLPDYDFRGMTIVNLGVLEGSLCLVTNILPQFDSNYVWVMMEYGVKESWTKLFRISEANIVGPLNSAPIVYSYGGDEVLLRKADEDGVFWYNVKDKILKPVPQVLTNTEVVDVCAVIGTLVIPIPDKR